MNHRVSRRNVGHVIDKYLEVKLLERLDKSINNKPLLTIDREKDIVLSDKITEWQLQGDSFPHF